MEDAVFAAANRGRELSKELGQEQWTLSLSLLPYTLVIPPSTTTRFVYVYSDLWNKGNLYQSCLFGIGLVGCDSVVKEWPCQLMYTQSFIMSRRMKAYETRPRIPKALQNGTNTPLTLNSCSRFLNYVHALQLQQVFSFYWLVETNKDLWRKHFIQDKW
jgi:hypothetical protein